MVVLPNVAECTTQLCSTNIISQNIKRKKKKRGNYNNCRKFSKKLKCPRWGRIGDWLFLCGTALTPGIIFYFSVDKHPSLCQQGSLQRSPQLKKNVETKKFLEMDFWLIQTLLATFQTNSLNDLNLAGCGDEARWGLSSTLGKDVIFVAWQGTTNETKCFASAGEI